MMGARHNQNPQIPKNTLFFRDMLRIGLSGETYKTINKSTGLKNVFMVLSLQAARTL